MPFIIQNTQMEGKRIHLDMYACRIHTKLSYILWEIWKFIDLHLRERKKERKVLSFLFYFVLGVLFGYFVVIPMSVNFVATFTVSDVVKINLP
jgi:sec-independent protein translocase protein TatC